MQLDGKMGVRFDGRLSVQGGGFCCICPQGVMSVKLKGYFMLNFNRGGQGWL